VMAIGRSGAGCEPSRRSVFARDAREKNPAM